MAALRPSTTSFLRKQSPRLDAEFERPVVEGRRCPAHPIRQRGTAVIETEREFGAWKRLGQRWAGTGAEPADMTGCTSSIAVETNSSAGGRFGVSTHCFTAPYIAQLAVAAIISWEMRRSSSG